MLLELLHGYSDSRHGALFCWYNPSSFEKLMLLIINPVCSGAHILTAVKDSSMEMLRPNVAQETSPMS